MSLLTQGLWQTVALVPPAKSPRHLREIVNEEPVDLDALRAALAAERVVSAELAHRNRNLVTVLAALVRRMLDGAGDLAEARAALEDMTVHLTEAHAALAPSAPRDLEMLARTTLAGFEAGQGRRVVLVGPKLALTPEADRMVALALFELATNSIKHGALGGTGGETALDWARDADNGLRLVWRESGYSGPVHPSRSGGGGALMRRIGEVLDGAVSIKAGERGVFSAEITLGARHLLPIAGDVPRRVLVVEDSPLIAVDLADMLEALGVEETVLAMTLADAGTALATGDFDLVLLDVSLGEASSDALLPDLAGVPVVVVSGRDAADLPAAFAGMQLLSKPFLSADLAAVLARWAEMRKLGP